MIEQLLQNVHESSGFYTGIFMATGIACYSWYIIWQEEHEDKKELQKSQLPPYL